MRPHELDASAAASVGGFWLRTGTLDPTPSGLLLAWLRTGSSGRHLTLAERADPTAGPWLGPIYAPDGVEGRVSCLVRDLPQVLSSPSGARPSSLHRYTHQLHGQRTSQKEPANNRSSRSDEQPSLKQARGGRQILGEWALTLGQRGTRASGPQDSVHRSGAGPNRKRFADACVPLAAINYARAVSGYLPSFRRAPGATLEPPGATGARRALTARHAPIRIRRPFG